MVLRRGGAAAWALCFVAGLALLAACTGDKQHTEEVQEPTPLTEEQKEYYRQIFEQYDIDGDGFITMEENLEQDRTIAEEQGKPFDEEHSIASFERTDLDKDGKVSLEEIMAPRPPEEQCRQLYGEFAEFDGVRSCKCMPGYTAEINGTCILGSTEVCIKQFGEFAEFDGVNNCLCKNSTIPDVNGTCIKGTDGACQEQFGELAKFDAQNSTCVCSKGSVPDTNGTCVSASNELCMEWFGPNTAFDGENSCVCKKGFVYADGECFRGTNKVCNSIIAGSKFDGLNSCKCRKGYEVDEARGMCKRSNSTENKDHMPLPANGTVTVTLIEGKHFPKMDTHTKCDPYAIITLGSSTRKTKVIKKTYAPEWGETFVMTYNSTEGPPPAELEIEFFDWDKIGAAEFIGKVTISLSDLLTEEQQGWVDLQGRDGALVKGHDKNISAANLQVSYTEGLPYIPFWEPILEEKPQWALDTVRAFLAVWLLVGALVFFVFRAKPVTDAAVAGDKKDK